LKKATAIFFLSLYLLSSTELKQLVKLPLLFQHYKEHKAQDGGISFLQFLRIHYHDATVMDADYDKDMQLPFKNHDRCHSNTINACTLPFFTAVIEKPFVTKEQKHIISNDDFINSVYLSSVWQPPRMS
jgi:hypothetical protein